MHEIAGLHQPQTLREGAFYERRVRNISKGSWDVSLVELIAYGNCAATVLVRDDHGTTSHIPRSQLFDLPEEAS